MLFNLLFPGRFHIFVSLYMSHKNKVDKMQYSILAYSAMSLSKFCLVSVKILYFLLLTILAFRSSSSTTFGGNETDHHALLAFKSMIELDPQGALSSWNDSSQYCQWKGVACSYRPKRVIALNLTSNGLVGSLSPYIGNLSFLREIRLGNNTLKANISNCSSLKFLALTNNKLVGEIPKELGSLSKLKDLWLHVNNLTKIPDSIGNLTSLQTFSAVSNLLVTLPDAIGKLKNMRELTLGDNQLSGVIPPSIYNLSLITRFSLAYNRLTGSLPPDLGLMMPHIQIFQLSGNEFSGTLPLSLSNASELVRIDIPYNNFTGKVSINFASLQNLWGVVLGANNLGSGEPDELSFISSLANCTNLHVVELQENQLKGELPLDVGNFSTKLFYFSLMRNHIYGDIPSGIGKLFNLTQLLLSENEFTGNILSNLGSLYQLQRLELDSNTLSGEIPASIGNLSFLNELYLGNNMLQRNIPPSLGSCKQLSSLDLSQNNLSGTIPEHIFDISTLSVSLNLSGNRLSGPLPSMVGKLRQLVALDVSENDLSAEIPDTIGSCTSLAILYVQGNFFEGSIPPTLSSMRGLQIIDFSRNNLSGQISEFLENLSLSYLNLSYNDFEGKVPTRGVFANASAISVAGNKKLCEGISELNLPTCSMNVRKSKMPRIRLVLVITAACMAFSLILVSVFLYCWLKRKKRLQSSVPLLKEPFSNLSYGELLKATDGFSTTNLIGAGSFACVYKGVLLDQEERTIAVKVLNLQRRGASQSFMAECEALRNIRHRNLLKIITSCSSTDFQGNDFKALVYEFIPNGSLDQWLHSRQETDGGQEQNQMLRLHQRLNVAIDVASALDYLHNYCERPIIHCDLKPSNVLLDGDMVAHVGDFGLAKFLPQLSDPNDISSIGIRGTVGYAAPEYGLGNEVSAEGDVYSYGILILEMITGKRPTDPMFAEGLNLHNFVKMFLPDNVLDVLDPIILNNIEEQTAASSASEEQMAGTASSENGSRNGNKGKDCLISMLKIGVACSMESPEDRMDMNSVVLGLHSVKGILQRT